MNEIGPRHPGAARPAQHPQLRQVQGLQRQPPDLQAQAGLAFWVLVIVFLLGLPCGETGSTLRTMVRSQP